MTLRMRVILFLVLIVIVALPILAQTGSVPKPGPLGQATDVPELAGKIVAFAGAIAAVLQGVKKWVPSLSGWPARLISIALALVGAYAAADPGQVLSIDFFLTAIGSALGANG